jgi:hypothetical protein
MTRSSRRPKKADPIFAAIDAHKAVSAKFEATCRKLDRAELADSPNVKRFKAEWERTLDADDAALKKLIRMKPATPLGAASLLAYVIGLEQIGEGRRFKYAPGKYALPSYFVHRHIVDILARAA